MRRLVAMGFGSCPLKAHHKVVACTQMADEMCSVLGISIQVLSGAPSASWSRLVNEEALVFSVGYLHTVLDEHLVLVVVHNQGFSWSWSSMQCAECVQAITVMREWCGYLSRICLQHEYSGR